MWAVLAGVLLLFSQTKLVAVMGVLERLGWWLRVTSREHRLYDNRRPFQLAASVAVATIVLVLLAAGIASISHSMKRHRLAVGFTGLAVGFGIIRFISLHEVDAWDAQMPWLRVVVDLTAATGGSAIAFIRLHKLGNLARPRRADSP